MRNEPEAVKMFDIDLILKVVYWASMVVVVGYIVIAKLFVLWAQANGHMDPAHEEEERRRNNDLLLAEEIEREQDRARRYNDPWDPMYMGPSDHFHRLTESDER